MLTTTVLTLIVLVVVIVVIYKYVIPSLPDPFNWIASLVVGVLLILYLLHLIGVV